jgi:hypothetical protein
MAMASIARKSEYVVASIALLLGLTSLVGACSSNNNRHPETTGSVGQAQAQPRQAYNSNLPPVIHAPQTTSATHTSYAPPPVYRTSYRNTAACNCPPPRRYDQRDITASIPQTQPPYGANDRVNFIVHPIAPRDTLYSISRHYRTSMDDIAAVNRIRTDSRLQVGELLVVPTGLR